VRLISVVIISNLQRIFDNFLEEIIIYNIFDRLIH